MQTFFGFSIPETLQHGVWKSQKKSHGQFGQTVLPDNSILIWQKLMEIQMRHFFLHFSNNVS